MHGEKLVTLVPAPDLKKIPGPYPRSPRLLYDRPAGGLPVLRDPKQVYAYLVKELAPVLDDPREHAYVLAVTAKNRLLTPPYLLSIGSGNMTAMCRREIFRYALAAGAAAIHLVHTHPSGDPTPSQHDAEITTAVQLAAAVISLEFLDHVILGGCHREQEQPRYYSFKEAGRL